VTFLQEEVVDAGQYRLHIVGTDKFKTNSIIIQLKRKLTGEDITIRALLPYVLQSGTENLPSAKQIRSYLDELYGASLTVDLSKKGEHHVITFQLDVANETFLSVQPHLFQKAFALLTDILLHPKTSSQNKLDEEIVSKEKRALKQRIQAIFDDKMRYANKRLIEEMCENEPYQQHVYGRLEKVDELTADQLYRYYERVIREDELDIYVVGVVKSNQVQQIVRNTLRFPFERKNGDQTADLRHIDVISEKETFEEQHVQQGKLHIGYRTYTTFKDDDYYALLLMNGIFGGFSHSKLFVNVREKESLAYYASSRLDSHKGLMFVMSGIEPANYAKTVAIIKEQMAKMKHGDFNDEEISQTKTMMKNQWLETIDNPRGIVEILYHQVIANCKRRIDEIIRGIDVVTREQIVDVAKKVKLDTIYFLKGKGAQSV